ncbi:MAG: bifunctional phosphoribosyl-AMP cyclohydrolase/phosphoribosyl-ATP diphosphatase HisIE [Chitinophagales bacterium]
MIKKNEIKFNNDGLIPAVVQDYESKDILMMAYMNEEALGRTLDTGLAWFYSRSRQELWQKGETSGNTMKIIDIRIDCDNDTLLLLVAAAGPACHTGHKTCFYRTLEGEELKPRVFDPQEVYSGTGPAILYELMGVIKNRFKERPEGSYTTYLFNKGIDKILKKVGEETAEVIIAAKNPGNAELKYETADLLYHLMVLMVEKEVELGDIFLELKNRR